MISLHIAWGSIALRAGGTALYAPKGDTLHRSRGALFAFAMLLMASSAVPMATAFPE